MLNKFSFVALWDNMSAKAFASMGFIMKETIKQIIASVNYHLAVKNINGRTVLRNHKGSVMRCQKAAELGHAKAQNELGQLHEEGKHVTKDSLLAAHWYVKAASQGNALAQYNLGCCYCNGDGVAMDRQQATDWLELAARNGLLKAQQILGRWYSQGVYVEVDLVKAYAWCAVIGASGNDLYASHCEVMAERMSPEMLKEAKELGKRYVSGTFQ